VKKELRFLVSEMRTAGGRAIGGYAAVFQSWSEDLGGFREQIAPGAFARSISLDDVVALFNHNPSQVLGRTKSGTLTLKEDSVGLDFRVSLPDTTLGNDLLKLVKRGDIRGCSFGFRVRKDDWNAAGDERTLLDVSLADIGPVTFPAYPSTTLAARSNFAGYDRVGAYRFQKSPGTCIYSRAEDPEMETLRRRQKAKLLRLEIEG
jgi:Escherichia/Staphylococcus phage prohead protease